MMFAIATILFDLLLLLILLTLAGVYVHLSWKAFRFGWAAVDYIRTLFTGPPAPRY